MVYDIPEPVKQALRKIRLVVFDFDGVFTDNTVYVSQEGLESVRCWRGDGIGLSKLRRMGIESMVLSTETNPVVSVRCQKLKIACEQGIEDKLARLEQIAASKALSLDNIAFVGNDINDKACLDAVGFSIVVNDAHLDVASIALYKTQASGGHGAVREVCDLFERVLTSDE